MPIEDEYLQGIWLACSDCDEDLSQGGANIYSKREMTAKINEHRRKNPDCKGFNWTEYHRRNYE